MANEEQNTHELIFPITIQSACQIKKIESDCLTDDLPYVPTTLLIPT